MTQLIQILPAIALRGTTILPDMIVHFDVSRERSVKAIEAAMLHDQTIFLVTQKDPEIETPGIEELYKVGTVAYIKQVVKLPHNLLRVLVEGKTRAELLNIESEDLNLMRRIIQSLSGKPCTGAYGHCSTAIVWTAGKSAVSWRPRS